MDKQVEEIVTQIKSDVIEAVSPAITEKVFDKVKEELPLRKDILGGNSADAELKERKEKAVEFFKDLAAGKAKAMTAGGSGSGAELVPTYVSDKIISAAEAVGLVQKYAQKWPMQGGKENVPTLGTVSAYRVNEGAKITSSAPSTGAVALNTKTVGVLVPVSRKLLANANTQLVDKIAELAGKAYARLLDKWALLGLTAGEGVFGLAGVPSLALATGNTTYAKVTAEDLLDTMNLINDSLVIDTNEKLRWVLSLSVLNAIRKQRAAVGADKQGFLFEGFGGQLPPTMWDLPYSLSPVMPKTSDGSQANKPFMALVNWDDVIFGEDQNYGIELSEQATITDTDGSTLINLFEQNMVAIKFSVEVDMQLANAGTAGSHAFIKTAAT